MICNKECELGKTPGGGVLHRAGEAKGACEHICTPVDSPRTACWPEQSPGRLQTGLEREPTINSPVTT